MNEVPVLRVMHVIPSLAPRFGGPSYAAIGMTRALARRGHRVMLRTTDAGGTMEGADRLAADGVDYRIFPAHFPISFKRSPELRRAIVANMGETDLVHIHALYLYPTLVAALTAQRYHVPYVIRPCGALDPFHLVRSRCKKAIVNVLIHDRVLRNASAFHFTSEGEYHLAKPFIFGRPGFVIPNGVDFGEFDDPPQRGIFRGRYPEIGDRRIVLFFGRINYKKGFEFLIPAFAELTRRRSTIHLVIAGPDDGHGSIVRRLVAAYDLASRVTITGMLTGRDRIAVLVDADVFVLPSHTENFSNALFEAMAAGLPVVVSDKVMMAEVIARAGAGIVVSTDAGAVAAGLERVLQDSNLHAAMAKRGGTFVRENYGWNSIAERLEVEYSRLTTGLPRSNATG